MTAESLYDYFERCVSRLPPQARLILVLDPPGLLGLGETVEVDRRRWAVFRYDGNDLAFRDPDPRRVLARYLRLLVQEAWDEEGLALFQEQVRLAPGPSPPLDQILEENFWPDEHTGRWRLPTPEERHRMSAKEEVAAQAHLRVIRRYLEGRLDRRPSDLELCAWIRYCYGREFYAEAVALFPHVDETRVDADEVRQVRKIVEVCRLKVETQ
jgi:hypothetical protein